VRAWSFDFVPVQPFASVIIKTIDAHAAGEPLRLIVDGFPSPRGRTMLERRAWAGQHADHLRRAVMLEPRGHRDMFGAVLTEPISPGAHAGLLFLHNNGFAAMSGHAIVAVTTIVLERGLLMPGGDGATIVYDTPAGIVRARARLSTTTGAKADPGGRPESQRVRVESVGFTGVPSFVLDAGVPVTLGPRHLRADLAFGGEFYAVVDGEAVGVPLDVDHIAELRRAGMAIARAVESTRTIVHPLEPELTGLCGTIFTGPSHDGRPALRSVAVFAGAQVDRSPCGTATCALMAIVDAMGLLGDDQPFVHEGLIGTTLAGRIGGRTAAGEHPAIVPEVEGSAWITGEHTFIVAGDDPLKDGFTA